MSYHGLQSPIIPFHSHPVVKAARPKWKTTRTGQRINALAEHMGKAMGLDLQHGLEKFKRKVNPEKVYQAWLTGDYHKVLHSVPWESFYEDLDPSVQRIRSAHPGAWELSADAIPAPHKAELRWDLQNPRIREFIASRRAYNFTNLTEDSAKNIRSWVSMSFSNAMTPRQVADQIKGQIGLLPAHADAVQKYRQGLLAAGNSLARTEALTGDYANRLLDYRAMMIGRTETRLATNQGQLTVWRQAADHGLINRHTARKRWIVMGPDPCDDCGPMEGRTVPLDSFWTMDDGTTVDCPPDEVHPHCFCGFDIEYGDEEGEE